MRTNIKILFSKLVLFLLFAGYSYTQQKADLVAFSYNRPIQLYALLESIETYITGLEEIHVIYRASGPQYEEAYQEIKETFNYVTFWAQGSDPQKDFKPLTLKASFDSPSDYIIFAVDDIIVKDFIDLSKSIELLEETNAYGLYFRLGLHLTRCYSLNTAQAIPVHDHVIDDVYSWKFKNGTCDWRYPNTVDMTLYRKKDIESTFRRMNYTAPNYLECCWAGRTNWIHNSIGLFHNETKIVNLPLNRVQDRFRNRTMNAFSAKELLDIFNQGLKIDISPLFKMKNKAAHEDYIPEFINR